MGGGREVSMSNTIPLRLMLFPPEEMGKALGADAVGAYQRIGSAYQILLSDGDHQTMVFGQLLAAAMKDHELHDGHTDLSSVEMRVLPDERFASECLTPDNQAITDYIERVAPLLTRSMDIVMPPSKLARDLFTICARAAREVAGFRMSLKNSLVGGVLAAMRVGEPCELEVNGTVIQGIDAQLPDHQILISFREAIASLD